MATLTCGNCGHENTATQRFCVSCGESLELTCAACGHLNPPDSRFCGNCGTALAAPAPAAALTKERRLVTVLFADISGFTSHSHGRDPEEVTAMIDSCMAKLGAIIDAYGGVVDKVIGDALMAVFGAPVAHENDPERAVRAALELQECAVENAEEFAHLKLRVGVNTGDVMFAPVGPDGRREFTVMGDVVNMAQRLETAAPTGGVLVGKESYSMTSTAIRYGEPVSFDAKGVEAPLQAWPALEALTPGAEGPAPTGPMVGRDRQFARLRDIWQQVADERRPQLITVFGPPGVGKTRLAAELIEHVEAQGARSLRGRSLPFGEQVGYGSFAQQLRELAGIFRSDSVQEGRTKLDQAVATVVESDRESVTNHLAVLTGLGGEEAIADREVLFLSSRRLVEALADARPAMLVFEDIQWADDSLLDLIEYLAEKVRDVPLLLLTLARPELRAERPKWGGGLESFSSFKLEPLSSEESQQLAGRLLGRVDPEVAAHIAARAEGNPLFIEELAASLREQTDAASQELPTSVKSIIASRIDALPPVERSAVLSASVVGKIFWRGALESLGVAGDQLDPALEELERRDFIRRQSTSSIEGDAEFLFKHMLTRDVAYETLPKAVRREAHATVARFIEQAAGDRVAGSTATLAHHWQQAGDTGQAVTYLELAAEQAQRAWAKKEAAALYAAVLDLLPADEVARRRTAQLRRAVVLTELSDLAPAVHELDELLPVLEGHERFEALRARGLAAHFQMQAHESAVYFQQAFELAEDLDRDEFKALALGLRAIASGMEGRGEEAVELDEQALAVWPPGMYEPERAEVLAWAGVHQYWIGSYERAVERSLAAQELARRAPNVYGLVAGGSHAGLGLTGLGRHEEALEVLGETIADGRDLELRPSLTARHLNVMAGTHHELYETAKGRELNEEAIELGRMSNFGAPTISGQIDLLVSDLSVGAIGQAETAWKGLWEAALESKGWHQWLWTTRLLSAMAEIELAAGRPKDAVDAAQRAIEHANEYRRGKYVVASRLTLGQALRSLGRDGEAVEEFRLALVEAQRLGHPPSIWRTGAALGSRLEAIGDDAGAEATLTLSRETLEQFAAALSPERQTRFRAVPQVRDILPLSR